MGRPEAIPLPQQSYSAKKKSALRSYLSLALPLAICTTLYFTNPAGSLARAWAQWDGDLSLQGYDGASCPAQAEPLNVGLDWKPLEDEEYREVAAKRLIGAVQIPTVSYDDMGPVGEEPRFEPLLKLHDYFEKTFPGVYSHDRIKLEKVNTYGLLYTWQGTNKDLKPIVLMGHQDVVPVNPDTVDRWTYPPFSGTLDQDGWIWGRGAGDCKNTLVGLLAAWERLAEDGFVPERTVIISSGFDEEIGGRQGAEPISRVLHDRYGDDGVALVLDEGFTGVDSDYGVKFARFGMAEKGAMNINLEVLTSGGHSSVPPKHTGIGIMSLLIAELEKRPAVPRLQAGNPLLSYLNCAADFGQMDRATRRRVRNEGQWQAFGEEMAEGDRVAAAFLGTTQAADLVHGGVKVNALPEKVEATVNYRVDFLSSVAAEFGRIQSILAPVVASLNLTFDVNGSHASTPNFVVRLSSPEGSHIEPAPLTPTKGGAFDLMAGTAKHVFGKETVVAPSGMIANTDTKRVWDLTRHIYRWLPAPVELFVAVHTVDEHVHIDAHLTTIQFYYKLIRNTVGWEAA